MDSEKDTSYAVWDYTITGITYIGKSMDSDKHDHTIAGISRFQVANINIGKYTMYEKDIDDVTK
jgi:hypothetical protein